MKRKILILLIPITIFFYPSYTQTAYNAEDLVQLIDKKDWFNCELVYKANKDSYNSFTQLKAESYLYTYFNQPEKAIEKLNIIADTHAESLGIKVIPFLDLLAKNYSYIQRYDKAHEIYSYLSKALLNVLPPNQLNYLKECARRYAAFKDIPRQEISSLSGLKNLIFTILPVFTYTRCFGILLKKEDRSISPPSNCYFFLKSSSAIHPPTIALIVMIKASLKL